MYPWESILKEKLKYYFLKAHFQLREIKLCPTISPKWLTIFLTFENILSSTTLKGIIYQSNIIKHCD